ncbi:MAG TPA: ABC transporter substrate-binding protein [Chloroflexota bacterium]|jgi:peptide/nickel transport system substrate-binding protein|nr:ABC transporter substrate-binding protein [Chloroflexota bacterium]
MAREGFGIVLGRLISSVSIVAVLFVAGSVTASARANPAAGPKVGGTYSIQVPAPPDCLDPQKTAAAASSTVFSYVVDPLLSLDNKGHFVGLLATSYKASHGGTVLTFHLRHGVKFSNGHPFTAAAVKYTFDRAVNPATKSPATGAQLADIKVTKVINKYTVQLDLKTPNRVIISNLADSSTGILDPKATQAEGSNSCFNPIGTGIYKVQSTGTAFSDVTLVTNKYHNYGPSWVHNHGNPYVPKIQVITIANEDTAISDLLTGAVSIAGVPGNELPRVKGNKSIVLHKLPSQNLIWASFNFQHKPFNNVNVRRAVAEVIDRKGIVKAALGGLGVPVANPLTPAYPFFDKLAAKDLPAFNIKAAAKVFKKYHVKGPYTLLACTCAPFATISEIVQADLKAAGVQVDIEGVGGVGDFLGDAFAGKYDIDLLNYSYPDPDVLSFLLKTGAVLNWLHYSNPTLDKLFGQEETTLNAKKDSAIFAKIQIMINKQAPFVGIATQTPLLGILSMIKGFHVNSDGSYAGQDLYIK